MELKYLTTFKVILDMGSFQKAAEYLNYAQSTITQQMQLLEQELSVKLFDRIGRRMELTQAGKELIPYIDDVLEAVSRMENYGKEERELKGDLRVSMPETLLVYRMQPVLKKFRMLAPKVKLSLQASNCYGIRDQVISGGTDIGLHYDVGGYGGSLVTQPLGTYPLALIANPELDGAECDYTERGQRKESSLLTVDKNSLYHAIFGTYLRERDITMNGEVEINSVEAVKRSVASNLGVACLPRFTAEEELGKGLVKELHTEMEHPAVTAVLSRHKNKWITPAMELFIRLVSELEHRF